LFGCGLAGIPLTIGDLIDHESKWVYNWSMESEIQKKY
jgi:hypothetical protein